MGRIHVCRSHRKGPCLLRVVCFHCRAARCTKGVCIWTMDMESAMAGLVASFKQSFLACAIQGCLALRCDQVLAWALMPLLIQGFQKLSHQHGVLCSSRLRGLQFYQSDYSIRFCYEDEFLLCGLSCEWWYSVDHDVLHGCWFVRTLLASKKMKMMRLGVISATTLWRWWCF